MPVLDIQRVSGKGAPSIKIGGAALINGWASFLD